MTKRSSAKHVLLLVGLTLTLQHGAWASPNEALWDAARRGDAPAVKSAIEKGADVDAKTTYGATALSFASDKGHTEVVKLLLENKADPNIKDSFYQASPLVWASMRKHKEVIRLLIAHGAEGADDVLAESIAEGNASAVQALIDTGKISEAGLSKALATATQLGKADLVEILTKSGAKPSAATEKVAVPPETLKRYAGAYKNPDIGLEITFVPDDGVLKGSVPGQPTLTYAPSDQTTFSSVEYPGIKVTFNEGDPAPSFRLDQAGQNFTFKRIEEKKADGGKDAPPKEDSRAIPSEPAKGDALAGEAPKMTPVGTKNWPSFRGVGARGLADGPAPLNWNAESDKGIAWKTAIPGLGHACPIVWGDRVFVLTAESSEPKTVFKHGLYGDVDSVDESAPYKWMIYALDKKSGKIVWEHKAHEGVPRVKRHTKASHANSTPATDGRHVVAIFGSEGLFCYDFEGKLLWKKDLGPLDSGWFYDPDYQWGFGSSPIIYNDMVIVQCDVQKNPYIAALSIKDGTEIWRTSRDDLPSWGSPTVVEGKPRTELLTNGTKAARAYDPKTGTELWRLTGHSEITVPTPFEFSGLVYITSGYRPVQPIFAIKLGGSGDITPKGEAETNEFVAWSKKKGGPYMPTPICYGDYFYTCSNQGILACHNAKTGEQIYKQRIAEGTSGGYTASPIAADGKIYLTSEDGDIHVIKAGPKFEVLAKNPMGEVCMATPAISDGMLFVRTEKNMYGIQGVKD